MVNTSQQVGGSVGTALLSTIFASAAASFVSAHAKTAGLASAATIYGYTTAFEWAAALFGIGLLVALLILPSNGAARARATRAATTRDLTSALKPPDPTATGRHPQPDAWPAVTIGVPR